MPVRYGFRPVMTTESHSDIRFTIINGRVVQTQIQKYKPESGPESY